MEGAEQDRTGLLLDEFVAKVIFARLEQNAFKIDALFLLFPQVQTVVLKMIVRVDTSATMANAILLNRATSNHAFLLVESAILEMFVRADTPAPMVDVNLVDQGVSGMARCVRKEICVRVELHASETGAGSLPFIQVEYANTEMFARLGISVSMVGAIQIVFVLVELVK